MNKARTEGRTVQKLYAPKDSFVGIENRNVASDVTLAKYCFISLSWEGIIY